MQENRKLYTFSCYGHPNILATHVKTLEITKDQNLTERGDCIIGIKSDFNIYELKKFSKKIKIVCETVDPLTNSTLSSEFKCFVNPNFHSNNELVLRKSHFDSGRTFGFNLNKGANNLDRKIVQLLKNPDQKMNITIIEGWY